MPMSGALARGSALLCLLLGGCLYGFAGGGLPPNIKTVAILPFENLTPEPTLTRDIQEAVRDALAQLDAPQVLLAYQRFGETRT